MRAAVLRQAGAPLTIEEIDIDDPGPGEVRIRTTAAGVCHSDLHFIEGLHHTPMPCVPGHESAGVVEAVGPDVTYVGPGDHVITCMSAFCGVCRNCTAGRPVLCESTETWRSPGQPPRLSQKGQPITQLYNLASYAEAMLVHERACVKVRPDMPLDRGALIGCAVMTGFGAVVNTARIPVGASVVVIGCGGIGLSAVNGAAIAGAGTIIAVDVSSEKLATARNFGATHVVDASVEDPVAAVRALTNQGADFAFEAVGRKETAEQAYEMIRYGGTAVVIGMVPQGQKLEIDAEALLMEKTLTGSNMGSNRFREDMPQLVEFYLGGKLHLDDMVTARVGLDDINEAFAAMSAGEVARSVIVFD